MGDIGFRVLLAAAAIAVMPVEAAAQQPQDIKTPLLTRAAASYYSLSRQGFAGARCSVTPDWSVVIHKSRNDRDSQAAFAIFDALHFDLTLNARGNVKLAKQDTGSGRTPTQASGIQQIFDGFDQEITGFFATWSMFVVNPVTPTPAQPGVSVAVRPGGYRITYKDGDADVLIDTDRAGVATHLAVTSKAFDSTIDPTFERTSEGLVLTRYIGDYLPASGPGKTHLVADISYQTVNGLKIPSLIKLDTIYDGQPARVDQTLGACQVTRNR